MARYEEQVSAVVNVHYTGSGEFARAMADFERIAGTVEGGASRIVNAANMAGQGLIGLAAAHRIAMEQLGLPMTQLHQMTAQFQAFERGIVPPQGLRETRTLIQGVTQDLNSMNRAGAAVTTGAIGRLRGEIATLITQQLGMQAAPQRRPTVRQVQEDGATRLETRAGAFRLMQAPGGGYSVLYPGGGGRPSGGQSEVFRSKADAISAVRDVLAAFGAVPSREQARALPPGVGGAPVPDAGAAAAQARVNARLERFLADQAAAGATRGPAQVLGVGPVGAGILQERATFQSLAEFRRLTENMRRLREAIVTPPPLARGGPPELTASRLYGRALERYMVDATQGPGGGQRPPVYRVTSMGGPGGGFDPAWQYMGALPGGGGAGRGGGGGIPPGGFPPGGTPPGGSGGGWRDEFMRGFKGRADRGYAEQLGQTFKFALFYGTAYKILFTLTQTLQVALDESVKFQQAMAELNIATGRSTEANKDLARNLGDTAAAAGQSPWQGIEIGARAIGLYDLQGSSQQVQEAAMRTATRAVTQLQFNTGRTPEQLQLDVGAISQAFDFGYQAINRIADLDAYFTKRFGIKPGQSLETTAQVGSLGIQAGFDPEFIMATAAKLQSRTGQTPAAVAGLLSQIFSRAGEGSLTAQFQRFGVDPNAKFAEQMSQLSLVYQNLSASERQEVTAAAGRGRSQGAMAVLLEDFQEIADIAKQAQTEAAGASEAQFRARMDNVGGIIASTAGAFKNFGIELGNTGLLDAFGAGAIALREMLQASNNVLRVWNEIPAVMRYAIYAIGAWTLAMRMGAGSAVLSGLGGVARASNVATRAPVLVNSAGAVVSRGAAARAVGTGALGLVGGPIGALALGTLTVIAGARNLWENLNQASQQATDAMLTLASIDFTDPGELRGGADTLEVAAKRRRDLGTTADVLSFFGAPFQDTADRESDLMMRRVERMREAADQAEAERAYQAENIRKSATPFGDLSTGAVETGFKQLEAAGVSAATRLRLFNEALYATGDAAREASSRTFDLSGFTGGIADEFASKFAAGLPEKGFDYTANVPLSPNSDRFMAPVGRNYGAKDIQNRLTQAFNPDDLEALLTQNAELNGIDSEALTQEQITQQSAVIRDYVMRILDPPLEAVPQVAAFASSFATKYLMEKTAAQRAAVDPNRIYTPEQLMNEVVNPQLKDQAGRLDQVPRGDIGGQVGALQATLDERLKWTDLTATNVEEVMHLINEAYADLSEGVIERMQTDTILAARAAPNLVSAIAGATANRRKMLAEAIEGRNPLKITELIEGGSQGDVEFARAEIQKWFKDEKAKLRDSEGLQKALQVATTDALAGGGDTMSASRAAAVKAARTKAAGEFLSEGDKALKALMDAMLAALDIGQAQGPSPQAIAAAQAGARLRPGDSTGAARVAMQQAAAALRDAAGGNALELANAQRAYNDARAAYNAAVVTESQTVNSNRAARIGGDLGNARAALQNARLELQKYAKGTQEFNAAMGQLFAAQNAFADAVRQAQTNRRLLAGDLSDPVHEATVQYGASRDALRDARRRFRPGGIDKDERAQLDVLGIQAERDRINQKTTAWQQQFSDMQIADQLGRISHAAYISYLQNESDRLHSIKNKQRWQIDQMNQVDQALKAATDQMQGQFNLGDIKLPTPYEVRRYIKATTDAQMVGASTTAGTTNNFYINGADTGQIETVVYQAVGAGSAGTFSTAAKKV